MNLSATFNSLWRLRLHAAVSGDPSRAESAADEVDAFAQDVLDGRARRALFRLAWYLRRAHRIQTGMWHRRRISVLERERRLDALAIATHERLLKITDA